MHPALSIIVFTTASGAGYGLLALMGILGPAGILPSDRWLGFFGLGLALALIAGGLMCSTAHLGNPQRAWRALSQWRSSWLSREGIASLVTFIPALAFAYGWAVLERTDGWVAAAGLLAAAGSVMTVYVTSMIYASLKPVPQWHGWWTPAAYLTFAAMTGAVLLNAVAALASGPVPGLLAAMLIAAGWLCKVLVWRQAGSVGMPVSAASATGLGDGAVRSVEWPHTEANYLLKEMGYRVARKHAAKLRLFVHLAAFAVPLVLTLAAAASAGTLATICAIGAVAAQVPGMLVERWLFFAEARHVVTVYYDGDAAPGR